MWLDNLVVATAPPGAPSVAPVAVVTVSPAAASISVGQTGQLTATPQDSSGNSLPGRFVTWASSQPAVATVDASGLVSGAAVGTATITATSEGQSGTVAVTVAASVPNPGTVTDLAVAGVTDSSMTLTFTEVSDGTGQPARYDVRYATGTIAWGAATSVSQGTCATPVAGSAIGALRTCTMLGLAPAMDYQVQLVAFRGTMNLNAVYGERSNIANGTTAAPAALPPPPPPPPPSPSGSNEPAGFTPIVDRPFDAVAELEWWASSLLTVVADPTAPKSAPFVGQVTFPAGFGGGYEPASTWTEGVDARGFTRMYLSFWVKLSSNWQGHNSGVNKIGFVWMHDNPVVYFSEQGSGSGNLEAQLRLQNTPAPARNLTPNLGAVSLTRGQWHRWEVVLVANTGDQANGEAHWWIDGVKVGEYTDVLYGSSTQPKAWGGPEISWMPIWGGIGDTVAETMYMWMDHFYMSGKTF